MSQETEDPALTEDLGLLFERNNARPLPSTGRPKRKATGSAKLRTDTRDLLIKELAPLGSKPCRIPVFRGEIKYKDRAGNQRKYVVGKSGSSDDVYCWFGALFAAEAKTKNDDQSSHQEWFEGKIHEGHGVYFVYWKPEEALHVFRRWFETHPGTVAEALRDRQAA